jgi:hypothetical protein
MTFFPATVLLRIAMAVDNPPLTLALSVLAVDAALAVSAFFLSPHPLFLAVDTAWQCHPCYDLSHCFALRRDGGRQLPPTLA